MWRTAVLILVALTMGLPVQAKPIKDIHRRISPVIGDGQGTVTSSVLFSPAERNLIRASLLGGQPARSQHLPQGLQEKVLRGKSLPPGWQKNVVRGHSLDYHVYRQGESLPESLLQRLPPSPVGSEIVRVENKIIRVVSATRMILDTFDLIPNR